MESVKTIKREMGMILRKIKLLLVTNSNLHFHITTHTQEQKFENARKPKVIRNSGKTNQKGPKRLWVSKDKIIYVADILCSKVQTPVMVPGLWMLATHDGKKVYVPKPGT